MIAKTLAFLAGKKTYIAAAIMVVLSGLEAQGYISREVYQTAMGVMTAAGFAALRAGVKKN